MSYKKSSLALAVLLGFSGQGMADVSEKQMFECYRLDDSLKRLACYENLTREMGNKEIDTENESVDEAPQAVPVQPTAPVAPQQVRVQEPAYREDHSMILPKASGNWTFSSERAATGEIVQVSATNASSRGRNQFGSRIDLVLSCQRGSVSAGVYWNDYLITGLEPLLEIHGSHPARFDQWQVTNNSREWHYRGDAGQLLQAMQGNRKASADAIIMENEIGSDDDRIFAEWKLEGIAAVRTVFSRFCR